MTEKDNKSIEKIKEKFSRIFRKGESKPRDLIKLNSIYETIRSSKDPLRISEISDVTKIKINSVRDYIKKYLEKKNYVKKSRAYTPPYLMVEHFEEDPEFIYGKEKRDSRIDDEKEILKTISKNLTKKEEDEIKTLIQTKDYNSQFFKLWDEVVKKIWKQNVHSANKIRIGSGANRYKI